MSIRSSILALLLLLASFGHALNAFGVGTHWSEAKYWPILKKAGVQWIRIDLSWYHFENSPGQFGNTSVDQALRTADSLGLKVVGILGYCPTWAASGPDNKFAPQEQFFPQWLAYLDSTVSRYQNQVDAWEIWNEPDHDAFFRSGQGTHAWNTDPSLSPVKMKMVDYLWLQTQSLQHLRAKFGAQLFITSSGFALGGKHNPDFYPTLLQDHPEIWKQQNALSIHGYGFPSSKSLLERARIAREFKKTYPTYPVWLTEHGVTGFNKQSIPVEDAGAFMVRNYALGLSSGIDKIFWFRLMPGNDYATLIDKSGTPTPFLGIYTRLIQHWAPATSITPWNGDSQLEGATAILPDKSEALILWSDNGSVSLSLPGIVSARDIFGNPRSIAPLKIDKSPLFITVHAP